MRTTRLEPVGVVSSWWSGVTAAAYVPLELYSAIFVSEAA